MSCLCEHADVGFAFATGSKSHPDYMLAVSIFVHPKKRHAVWRSTQCGRLESLINSKENHPRKENSYLSSQKSFHHTHAAKSFSRPSRRMSACFFWKISMGLRRTAWAPEPPMLIPMAFAFFRISSRRGESQAMKVPWPLPRRFWISFGNLVARRSRPAYR